MGIMKEIVLTYQEIDLISLKFPIFRTHKFIMYKNAILYTLHS